MAEPKRLAEVQRALRLTALLLEIAGVLERAGVEFIAFKGPTLSLLLYGDFATRAYGDLDLLVSPDDLVRAHGALTEVDFEPDFEVGDAQLRWLANQHNEFGLVRNGARVELHTAVVRPGYRFSLSFEDLMPHQINVQVAGRVLPVLRNEALAVVLAVHGAKHAWSRRSWIEDFAKLAFGSVAIDWEQILAFADQQCATRFVLQGAWLARLVFEVSLPPIVEQRLRNDPAGRFSARFAKSVGPRGSDSLTLLAFTLGMSDRASRLRVVQQLFVDPSPLDCQLVDLPEPLFPLYHAVRPLRLLVKHVLRVRRPLWGG